MSLPPPNLPPATSRQTPPKLPDGSWIADNLQIIQLIGQGGMGAVYRAHDGQLQRDVAIKVLFGRTDKDLQRILAEARAVARVVHPHVAVVHGVGQIAPHFGFGTPPYITMELVKGQSLRQCLRAGLPQPLDRALWIAQLASALGHAHDVGVLHCDVKPENAIVRDDQTRGTQLKLVDFGLARRDFALADRALSQGTAAYLAPELQREPPSPASDQFALAIMAVELLTGQRPTRPHWHQGADLPVTELARSGVPLRAIEALAKGLSLDPGKRFASVPAFADALLRGLGLPHARAGLVVPLPLVSGATSTSAEIPVLPAAVVLQDHSPSAQIMLILAVAPPGYPALLPAVLGREPEAGMLYGLQQSGAIAGGPDEWRLGTLAARDTLLASLAKRTRRQLQARVAMALEQCGPRRESTREDATRLYMAARRLGDAARLAWESAAAAQTARQRDHHLARATALLTSSGQPEPWLEALLRRAEWALRCGWLDMARGPLAEAQGIIADTDLPLDHPLRLRLHLAMAELLGLSGDLRSAQAQLTLARRVVPPLPSQPPYQSDDHTGLQLLLHARELALLGRQGERESVLRQGQILLEYANSLADINDLGQMALGQIQAMMGTCALRLGKHEQAEHWLLLALATHQMRGDVLHCASALLVLGNLALDRGHLADADNLYADALAVLAPLGPIELTALVLVNQGGCWLRLGQLWPALRAVERAAALFAEHGLHVHNQQALQLLAQCREALGDQGGGVEARAEAERLGKQRR